MALNVSGRSDRSGIVKGEDAPTVKREITQGSLKRPERATDYLISPVELYARLNEYVVGQHEAKKAVCIAAVNHLKRLGLNDPSIKKSNIMLVGPTGCGKTHLISSLAKILDVPFASVSATGLTAAGYVGGDVEDCLNTLIVNASQMISGGKRGNLKNEAMVAPSIAKAEKGIILIDEVDKIRKQKTNSGRDIGGEAVQQGLLTMIEGSMMSIKIKGFKRDAGNDTVTIDTSNILFVFSGAFPEICDIVRERLATEGSEDMELADEELYAHITDDDLERFGFIPEFIGRIPIVTHIRSLTVNDYARILTEPKDAVFMQMRKLFAADGSFLVATEEVIQYIAKKAQDKKRGARGLRTVVESILADAQFLSASFREEGLEFFMTLFDDGEPGTVVKAPAAIAAQIRELISSGRYGTYSIEIIEKEDDPTYQYAM